LKFFDVLEVAETDKAVSAYLGWLVNRTGTEFGRADTISFVLPPRCGIRPSGV
jgi:hypothetical protein